MRIVAMVANVALLLYAGALLFSVGLPVNTREMWLVLLVVIVPILNLVALLTIATSNGWLALFLKRKALEEQKRIDELGKHSDG
jgi:hypothetical protein